MNAEQENTSGQKSTSPNIEAYWEKLKAAGAQPLDLKAIIIPGAPKPPTALQNCEQTPKDETSRWSVIGTLFIFLLWVAPFIWLVSLSIRR